MEKQEIRVPMNVDSNFYYVSNILINYSKEEFLFGLNSGGSIRQYILSPEHAKRLSLVLKNKIEEYEKGFSTLSVDNNTKKADQSSEKIIGFKTED